MKINKLYIHNFLFIYLIYLFFNRLAISHQGTAAQKTISQPAEDWTQVYLASLAGS